MKDVIMLFSIGVITAASVILINNTISINFKLNKLIELNTPEYVNVVPDKPLLEKQK